jgi:Fe-S-cluster containining protein
MNEIKKENKDFPCTRCGACCMRIGHVVAHFRELVQQQKLKDGASRLLASFPFDTPGGICEKYNPAVGCMIFDQRPVICDFKKLYQVVLQDVPDMTLRDFHQIIAMGCNHDILILGLDPSYYVEIE